MKKEGLKLKWKWIIRLGGVQNKIKVVNMKLVGKTGAKIKLEKEKCYKIILQNPLCFQEIIIFLLNFAS